MVCDVLAGEQGPSCRKVEHVPDLKVFYVRFVKRYEVEVDEPVDVDLQNDTQLQVSQISCILHAIYRGSLKWVRMPRLLVNIHKIQSVFI